MGFAYKFCLAVARQTRRPPLAVLPAGKTSLRSSNPTAKANSRLCSLHAKYIRFAHYFAEGVGFEPTGPLRGTAFQAVSLSHSDTLPKLFFYFISIPRRAARRSSTGGWVINIFMSQLAPCLPLKGELMNK